MQRFLILILFCAGLINAKSADEKKSSSFLSRVLSDVIDEISAHVLKPEEFQLVFNETYQFAANGINEKRAEYFKRSDETAKKALEYCKKRSLKFQRKCEIRANRYYPAENSEYINEEINRCLYNVDYYMNETLKNAEILMTSGKNITTEQMFQKFVKKIGYTVARLAESDLCFNITLESLKYRIKDFHITYGRRIMKINTTDVDNIRNLLHDIKKIKEERRDELINLLKYKMDEFKTNASEAIEMEIATLEGKSKKSREKSCVLEMQPSLQKLFHSATEAEFSNCTKLFFDSDDYRNRDVTSAISFGEKAVKNNEKCYETDSGEQCIISKDDYYVAVSEYANFNNALYNLNCWLYPKQLKGLEEINKCYLDVVQELKATARTIVDSCLIAIDG